MQVLPPAIEVYPVHHLPLIKAYADQLGLVSLINHYVPTAMEVDAGPGVLALVLDTLSGRSPLSRLAEVCTQQDPTLTPTKSECIRFVHSRCSLGLCFGSDALDS